jgi:hypothetical protein
MNGG